MYTFDKTMKVNKWTVSIDTASAYGYFEHDDYGEGGGLWFTDNELTDYDGVAALPIDCATAIRALGYLVDDTCC